MDARVERYGRRTWAVWVCDRLVCVCLYKRGAVEVQRILNAVHANLLAVTLGIEEGRAA